MNFLNCPQNTRRSDLTWNSKTPQGHTLRGTTRTDEKTARWDRKRAGEMMQHYKKTQRSKVWHKLNAQNSTNENKVSRVADTLETQAAETRKEGGDSEGRGPWWWGDGRHVFLEKNLTDGKHRLKLRWNDSPLSFKKTWVHWSNDLGDTCI